MLLQKRHSVHGPSGQSARVRTVVSSLLVVLSMAASSGCGEKGPKMAPVKGTVLIDGKPAAGATVKFTMAQGNRIAVAKADASGNFQLLSKNKGDGAQVGDYVVTITLLKPPPPSKKPPPDYAIDIPAPPIKKSDWIIPEKYSHTETSGLTAQVKEGTNEFRFDLKSK